MIKKGSDSDRPSVAHSRINWTALARYAYHERGDQPNCQGRRERSKVRSWDDRREWWT